MSTTDKVTSEQHVTFITNGTSTGTLHSQIKNLVTPPNSELTHVHVYSSMDNSMALNVFSFQHKDNAVTKMATHADAKHIFDYLSELKAGKHANDKTAPKYSETFSEANMDAYLKNLPASYASKSTPRRFLIQKEMYDRVKGAEVHIEEFEPTSSWVTIAAANVLPDVLLRLSSSMIAARGLDVSRAHLDSILDETNNLPDHVGNVTMLRLLVSSKDVSLQHGHYNLLHIHHEYLLI